MAKVLSLSLAYSIIGEKCKRGKEYIHQEITDPHRTLQTSIKVNGGISIP